MQRGGQLLIVLGLILAFITAGLVYTATGTPVATKAETRPVVVAVQDIQERVPLEAPMLAVKEWPVDSVPADALSRIDDALGKASLTRIFAGEAVLKAKLVDAKLASALTFLIPPGMVAVAILSSEGSAVAGAIQPGDYVDVLLTLTIKETDIRTGEESLEQPTSQLILQDVKVISLGVWTPPQQQTAAAGGDPLASGQTAKPVEVRTITVLVTVQDALVLKYASEQGTVSLALRAYNDHDKVTTDSVYIAYMVDRFNFAKPPIILRNVPTPVAVR